MKCDVLRVAMAGILGATAFAQSSVDGHVLPDYCKWIFIAAAIIGGFIQIFLGYKLFKTTLFVCGFLGAGVSVFLPILDYAPWSWSIYLALGLGVFAGSIVGGVAAYIPKIGVFLVGAAAGAAGGFFVNGLILFPVSSVISISITCTVMGLVTGVLALFLMRIIVVISTAIIGGFMVVYAIGNCPPDPSQRIPDVFHLSAAVTNGSLPQNTLPYFAAWGVLTAIGIIIQFCITARKKDAKEKDEWEEDVEASEIIPSKSDKKSKKDKKKKDKKGKKLKADALLHDYEQGGEFYEDGYYDDQSQTYYDGSAASYADQYTDDYGNSGDVSYGYEGEEQYYDAPVPAASNGKSKSKKKGTALAW